MFVQTEATEGGMLLATRRRRTPDEPEIWGAHMAVIAGPSHAGIELETDRARFLGRGRTLRHATALANEDALSGTVGTVLDSIFSLRCHVTVAPRATVQVAFWTMAAGSRDAVLRLGRALARRGAADRVLVDAAAHAGRERTRLGLQVAQTERYAYLVSPLLYADPDHRAAPEALARGRGGPTTLWEGGISGDRPIVLLCVTGPADLDAARDLLRAQLYWRAHRLGVDVVLLETAAIAANEPGRTTLAALVRDQAATLATTGDTAPASVFLCPTI